jgi:uncharacterized protein (DUF342 family)
VVANEPFLRVTQPQMSVPGRDVYGRPIQPKSNFIPPALELSFPPEIRLLDATNYVAKRSGQVTLKNNKLEFSDTYKIEELGRSYYQKRVWPCSVMVVPDLEAPVHWEIQGDLEVLGHWACPNIVVQGDASAKSGIHTNMVGCVKIFGNFESSYIQVTRLGVGGNLIVTGSILQSEVRALGTVQVRGAPGAIMGSTLEIFGSLISNKVGSDSGRKTFIRIHKTEKPKKTPTRIGSLAKGTEMMGEGTNWIQETDGVYSV